MPKNTILGENLSFQKKKKRREFINRSLSFNRRTLPTSFNGSYLHVEGQNRMAPNPWLIPNPDTKASFLNKNLKISYIIILFSSYLNYHSRYPNRVALNLPTKQLAKPLSTAIARPRHLPWPS